MSADKIKVSTHEQPFSGEDRETLLGDVIDEYHVKKKTGSLYVVVKQSTEYLVRFYFKHGEVYYVSYGPLKGAECLDLLECYDFNKGIFLDGINAPSVIRDLPDTVKIISLMRRSGKTVIMDPLSWSSATGGVTYAAAR